MACSTIAKLVVDWALKYRSETPPVREKAEAAIHEWVEASGQEGWY